MIRAEIVRTLALLAVFILSAGIGLSQAGEAKRIGPKTFAGMECRKPSGAWPMMPRFDGKVARDKEARDISMPASLDRSVLADINGDGWCDLLSFYIYPTLISGSYRSICRSVIFFSNGTRWERFGNYDGDNNAMNWYCDVTPFRLPENNTTYLRIENAAYGILPGVMVGYEDGQILRWDGKSEKLIVVPKEGDLVIEYREERGQLVTVDRVLKKGEGELPANYEKFIPAYVWPKDGGRDLQQGAEK